MPRADPRPEPPIPPGDAPLVAAFVAKDMPAQGRRFGEFCALFFIENGRRDVVVAAAALTSDQFRAAAKGCIIGPDPRPARDRKSADNVLTAIAAVAATVPVGQARAPG